PGFQAEQIHFLLPLKSLFPCFVPAPEISFAVFLNGFLKGMERPVRRGVGYVHKKGRCALLPEMFVEKFYSGIADGIGEVEIRRGLIHRIIAAYFRGKVIGSAAD